MLSQAAAHHSKQPVIVIDEFERLKSDSERALFADLIEQTGDQAMPFKLIFCGVASSLSELLDAHHSCYRYLVTVELERIPTTPGFDIVNEAASAVGVEVEPSSLFRISSISDGFPHYVHLIAEKLLWEILLTRTPLAFRDQRTIWQQSRRLFSILKRNYARPMKKRRKSMLSRISTKLCFGPWRTITS